MSEAYGVPDTANAEAHITVEPGCDAVEITYEGFVDRSKEVGWRASMFDHDDVDGIAGKWFLTQNGTLGELRNGLPSMVHGLECSGFSVLRAKLEIIYFDTKLGGTWEDLK